MPVLLPPPRWIPPSVKIRLLWGNFLQQAGWLFLACSAMMVVVCLRAPDWQSLKMTPENLETVSGRITQVIPYSSTENGSGFSYECRFSPLNGGPRVAFRFSEGGPQKHKLHAWVPVEYLRENPLQARLQGAFNPVWVWIILSLLMGLLFLAFGALNVLMIVIGWREGQTAILLLQNGVLQTLETLALTPPEPRGEQGVARYAYSPLGAEPVARMEKLEHRLYLSFPKQGPWHVLYLPQSPEKSRIYEALGSWLSTDATGKFTGRSVYFLYLLTPCAAVALFFLLFFFQETPLAHFF